MAQLPERRASISKLIYESIAATQSDSRREHLGASQIGRECERQIWYGFRWAKTIRHDGRLLRLFDSGNHAEPCFVADLRRIGVTVLEVDPSTGRQWVLRDEGGHFGGSMDGAGLGIPEALQTWHVLEFKTHGEKSFKELEAKGVMLSKPDHYAQMQVYMHLSGMTRALYLAVNKNTDDLYAERVRYDAPAALRLIEKARRIVSASAPPPRMSNDRNFYLCKWCDFHDICHGDKLPERNCRTCLHSTPVDGGSWACAAGRDMGGGKAALPCHRYIPPLVPLEQVDVQEGINGERIIYKGWVDHGQTE